MIQIRAMRYLPALLLVAFWGVSPPAGVRANPIRAETVMALQRGKHAQALPRAKTRQPFRVTSLASGLEHPWGMAFLPDGSILVTERPGRLRLVTAKGLDPRPIAGVPEVVAQGQGGLLDVALHPELCQKWLDLPGLLGSRKAGILSCRNTGGTGQVGGKGAV